jgi:hypothetical protein
MVKVKVFLGLINHASCHEDNMGNGDRAPQTASLYSHGLHLSQCTGLNGTDLGTCYLGAE